MAPVAMEAELERLQPKPLQDKVALVTGGARGIGRAIVMELAARGANVAVHYRTSSAESELLSAELLGLGADALLVQGDVSSKDDSRRVMAAVLDKYKRVDILVNNAEISRDKTLRKMTGADWSEVLNNNLNSTFYCVRAALPSMIEKKFGRIVNIASFVAQSGGIGQANYAASKGAIVAFTETVAIEMAQYNITANVISPGYTATEAVAGMPARALAEITAQIPLKRLAEPREIALAVAFLVTDGSYITGHQLNVNGGIYM